MGVMQSGLPTTAVILKNMHKINIDLKDCFHTIPLHSDDCKKFSFSVPVCIKAEWEKINPLQPQYWLESCYSVV